MQKGYSIEEDAIVIHRDLTSLDLFVKDFLAILNKHTSSLVVSGYVSISTGRTRATEDVDILIPLPEKNAFGTLFQDLIGQNFWCYQGDNSDEAYGYLQELVSIRFARKNEMFPNIELVPFDQRKKAKAFEFAHQQKIRVREFTFTIPVLEFEILYKEIALGSEKDRADALHLRTFFSEILKEENFKKCRSIILSEHESSKATN